jgi:hypothetical protein
VAFHGGQRLWAADGPTLGALLPLSGELAAYGAQARLGIDLAVAEINTAGGLAGAPVRVVYEDDRSDARTAVERAVRRDHPFAAYGELPVKVVVVESGDVKARTLVRVEEARESARLIRRAVERLPGGPLTVPLGPLPADQAAFGLAEGWRGMIIHWIMVDSGGKLRRVKVLDPSFLNWRPLSYALLKNIVADFPLCNKSFNQPYSGNDL